MKKISPNNFRYDNSSRATYTSITLLWDADNDKPKTSVVGYCGGDRVFIEKPDTYAVMFNLKGDEVWTHLPKGTFERYLKYLDKEELKK